MLPSGLSPDLRSTQRLPRNVDRFCCRGTRAFVAALAGQAARSTAPGRIGRPGPGISPGGRQRPTQPQGSSHLEGERPEGPPAPQDGLGEPISDAKTLEAAVMAAKAEQPQEDLAVEDIRFP